MTTIDSPVDKNLSCDDVVVARGNEPFGAHTTIYMSKERPKLSSGMDQIRCRKEISQICIGVARFVIRQIRGQKS